MHKLSSQSIENNNKYADFYYKEMKRKIEAYENDTNKERRLQVQECKSCFYLKNGGSLQAFTSYRCKNCDLDQMWHNSRTPRYCNRCAAEYKVCVRCGCSI